MSSHRRINVREGTVEIESRPGRVTLKIDSIYPLPEGISLTAAKARKIADALNLAADASASADGQEV